MDILKLLNEDLDSEINDDYEDSDIVNLIYTLSHTKDIDGENVPAYCFLHEITDVFGISDEEAINIAVNSGYKVFEVQSNEDIDGTTIIADKDCTEEMVKTDYDKFYGVDVDVDNVTATEEDSIVDNEIDDSFNENDIKEESIEVPMKRKYSVEKRVYIAESLDEDIEKHNTLNPKLFDGAKLKREVSDKVKEIVDKFVEDLQEDDIDIIVDDIVLIGSNVSYNYTKDSDLDIHIKADTDNLSCMELYPLLYSAYRSLFNKKYDIDFYDIPVEIFVDTDETKTVSNGIYSVMKDEWIKEPTVETIPDIDEESFEEEFGEWLDKYNETKESNNVDEITNYIEDIYDLRKESIATDGEYGIGNLVFKELRNLGCLDELKELKRCIISCELSLNDKKENSMKFKVEEGIKESRAFIKVRDGLYTGRGGKIKTFAIITPYNPIQAKPDSEMKKKYDANHKEYNKEAKAKFTHELHIDRQKAQQGVDKGLKYGGFSYVPISEKFGDTEKSYFIINLSLNDAKTLARDYGQQSFLFGKTSPEGSTVAYYETQDYGDHYNFVEASKKITDRSEADDYYSKFGIKFNVDFDKFGANLEKDYKVDQAEFESNLDESISDKNTFLNRAYFRRRLKKD